MEAKNKCDIDKTNISSLPASNKNSDPYVLNMEERNRNSPLTCLVPEFQHNSIEKLRNMKIEYSESKDDNHMSPSTTYAKDFVKYNECLNQRQKVKEMDLTHTSTVTDVRNSPKLIRQGRDVYSNEVMEEVPKSDVYNLSAGMPAEDNELENKEILNMLYDNNLAPKISTHTSSGQEDVLEDRHIINIQGGAFGSIPRPPRPSASFCKLDVSTDLNLPPPNWLNVDPSRLPPGLAGFNATPHYSGFSSFKMASLFLDYSSKQR